MKTRLTIILLIFSLFTCKSQSCLSDIEQLLPTGDKQIAAYQNLEGGASNNIILCTTLLNNFYIFRQIKKPININLFNQILSITQKAADLEFGPRLYGSNSIKQQMLLEYINSKTWPSYNTNNQPYISTMQLLRKFHDTMRPYALENAQKNCEPFSYILSKEEILINNSQMPKQLKLAFDKIKEYKNNTAQWCETNATVIHGDFKKENVLLVQQENYLRPWLIDFDSKGIGHPFFDVAKFSQKLLPEQRIFLLKEYLNRKPTYEEINQFYMIDNTRLMLIAIIRFEAAIRVQNSSTAPFLSKQEMENLLDSPDALPSQSTISLSDPDPRKQQLAAIYSLHHFLRNVR